MLKEFKAFLLRGNVMELAIGVVIALAFKAIVDSLVNDIIMPIVGIFGGKPNFNDLAITINHSVIHWGSFLTAIVSFVIVAAALFIVSKGVAKVQSARKAGDAEPEPLSTSEELLVEIRDLLQRGTGPTA